MMGTRFKKILAVLLTIGALSFAYAAEIAFNQDGLAIENGQLVRIDRARKYLEIDFGAADITSLTADKKKCKIIDKDGNEGEKELYLFEDVSVKRLVFRDTITEVNSQIFTKIQDLEEIVFEGETVPTFKEEHFWLKWGEDDWRASLRRIVFKRRPQLTRIDFISSVEEIVLSENAPMESFPEDLKGLSQCTSLKRLVVPYTLAAREDVPWAEILQRAPIGEDGVCSTARGGNNVADGDDCVLLWPVIKGGRITMPDKVTHIRTDVLTRVSQKHGNLPVVLPPSFKQFIGGLPNKEQTFYLKQDAIQTFPDVVSLRVRGRSPVFPRFADKTVLSVTSSYSCLWAGTAKEDGEPTYTQPEANGLVYRVRVPLEMDCTHTLKFAFPGRPGNGPQYEAIIDPGKFESRAITFKTPPERHWVIEALLWCALGFFGIPLAMWALRFVGLMPTATKRYFAAPWGTHILFCCAVVIFALGVTGILADLMDLYVWYTVLEYVNTSMISSLIISVSTTIIQLTLALLKSLSFSLVFVQVEMAQVLEPVTDVLGRISWMSWLSTMVLTGVRMMGEILRSHGTLLWGCVGGVAVTWFFPGTKRIRSWKGYRIIANTVLGITVLLPFTLLACSWFSGALLEQAGNTLNDALISFQTLAESFTFRGLRSMSALQEMIALLGDAVAMLCASAIGYVVVKAFDCFLVPLGLLWVLWYVLHSFGIKQEADFRKLLRPPMRQRNVSTAPALPEATHNQALPASEETAGMPLSMPPNAQEKTPKDTAPTNAEMAPKASEAPAAATGENGAAL